MRQTVVRDAAARRRSHLPLLVGATSGVMLFFQACLLYAHPLLRGGVGQDTIDLYAGALALRHGLDPYTAAASLGQGLTGIAPRVHPFIYALPPFMPALTLPLTWVSPGAAYRLLLLVNAVCVALGALLVLLAAGIRGRYAVGVSAIALASGAGFLADWYGQITPLVMLAAAAAVFLASRGRLAWAGGVATLTLMKPQLSALALIVAFLSGDRKLRRGMILGGLGLVAVSLLTLGPRSCLAFIQTTLGDAKGGNRERIHDPDSLALDGIYYQILPHLPATILLVVTIAAVGIAGLALVRVARDRAQPDPLRRAALAALVLLDSLVLPYSHQYDSSILLLPYLLILSPLPTGRLRPVLLILSGMAALAPYSDLFKLSWGVRPLPLIDLCVALLLCMGCLRWSERSPRLPSVALRVRVPRAARL